ncbi:uncharacterized protein Tco025E_03182 [Trypanosoma conorhini]|uniref:Uncharacterized protein n=1 Tax=Trypanosoma conorhini TaxID=83891 RepID=A0A422PWY4_9TRYP|nr:uncharacterized protein Tco025E_03182 [Trypanosoma conorhini]RNF22250.1 hypothetical protein Tco025E_03182 [Trypanosoma conorhini]
MRGAALVEVRRLSVCGGGRRNLVHRRHVGVRQLVVAPCGGDRTGRRHTGVKILYEGQPPPAPRAMDVKRDGPDRGEAQLVHDQRHNRLPRVPVLEAKLFNDGLAVGVSAVRRDGVTR